MRVEFYKTNTWNGIPASTFFFYLLSRRATCCWQFLASNSSRLAKQHPKTRANNLNRNCWNFLRTILFRDEIIWIFQTRWRSASPRFRFSMSDFETPTAAGDFRVPGLPSLNTSFVCLFLLYCCFSNASFFCIIFGHLFDTASAMLTGLPANIKVSSRLLGLLLLIFFHFLQKSCLCRRIYRHFRGSLVPKSQKSL